MHAGNIARHARASLAVVFDIVPEAAGSAAAEFGCEVAADASALIRSPSVDAVLIASATETHADYIEMALDAAKPVFCEKPIDLSLERVDRCARAVRAAGMPVQLGFNRRFDPGHRAARDAVRAGEIGALQQVIISSRDPGFPPREYLRKSGGLFRDMTIHDFDMARFMLMDEPVEVFAAAGALLDPTINAEFGDVDSAMFILRTADGKQCHINNSRAAAYGYDQRVELFGQKGMLVSGNRRAHEMRRFGGDCTGAAEPYLNFFVERYQEAFNAEIEAFVDCVERGGEPEVGFEDGRRAQILAEAAYRSLAGRRVVGVDEIA
jgi:myo-inositol 2-dehydrogenase/D-chiro-inositol 1-dehydrogenase